jgi:hypothetical protein
MRARDREQRAPERHGVTVAQPATPDAFEHACDVRDRAAWACARGGTRIPDFAERDRSSLRAERQFSVGDPFFGASDRIGRESFQTFPNPVRPTSS